MKIGLLLRHCKVHTIKQICCILSLYYAHQCIKSVIKMYHRNAKIPLNQTTRKGQNRKYNYILYIFISTIKTDYAVIKLIEIKRYS